MKVLYIGGTGQISFDCVHESVRAGHDVFVYNRGRHNAALPDAVTHLPGDVHDDDAYRKLRNHRFDAVCQFRLFNPDEIDRDLDVFTGSCGQYVFISTASAYQKPPTSHVITEVTPLDNPFWEYSRKKIEMERRLQAQTALPFTVVRPSHTSRTMWIAATGDGPEVVRRMREGKPVVVPGDGTSLWTIMRGEDFAPPFVKLLGKDEALGEALHLTSDNAYMWNDIYHATARAIGVGAPQLVHVPTDTLIRYRPEWEGPLLGDKSWSAVFDNTKIKSVVGGFSCDTTLDEFMQRIAAANAEQLASPQPNPEHDALVDRIVAEQSALGR